LNVGQTATDIDFTPAAIEVRRQAGYEETAALGARKPWMAELDPIEGMMIHEPV